MDIKPEDKHIYDDFVRWAGSSRYEGDLEGAWETWKAATDASLEYCLNAMRVNQESFNRQCIVDVFKDFVKTDVPLVLQAMPNFKEALLLRMTPFLAKWGLSDAQIKDVLGE